MAQEHIFKSVLGKCPAKQKLSQSKPDGAGLGNIIQASVHYGDNLHEYLQEQLDLNEHLQVFYHQHCISTYLACAPSGSKSLPVDQAPIKRMRRSDVPTFNFREHCIYCGECCMIEKDRKNPNRWVPAFLVKGVATNELDDSGHPFRVKDKILQECQARGDQWAVS